MVKFSHLETISSMAVVGATGLVGQEFLSILDEHKIRIPKLRLLSSSRSAGEVIEYAGHSYRVDELGRDSFEGIEAAFFSVPADVTRRYAPIAVDAGATVVDDSSVFRLEKDVPLVVPEINGSVLRDFSGSLLSTPNCSTTPIALLLKPLLEQYGVERVVVSTYQSVSGAGRRAAEELSNQTVALMNGTEAEIEAFPHRVAFNCLPFIGKLQESGFSDEEEKIGNELRKILGVSRLKVCATAVRVPTFSAHGASVNIEFKNSFENVEEIREVLDKSPGVKVLDRPDHNIYPTGVEAAGDDAAFVGRVRRDPTVKSGICLWVIADNLRKGAALNALQIFDTLYRYRRMS